MPSFLKDTATTATYALSLHDALPIFAARARRAGGILVRSPVGARVAGRPPRHPSPRPPLPQRGRRSEEHTSELQSRRELVCRLLLEKKNSSSSVRIGRIITLSGSRTL